MSWNTEQAANDLERYLLRKEPPAVGAVELAINVLRSVEERTCKMEYENCHGHEYVRCSFCHIQIETPTKIMFCPICGARVVE